MAKYKILGSDDSNGVFDTETNATIPNAGGNTHWAAYQQWLLGNNPDGTTLDGNPGVQTPDAQYTLTEIRDNKKEELKQECNTIILAGFTSNATGTTYTYESSLKDQANLQGAAQAAMVLDYTVVDGGNKIRVSHTAVQMQQVFMDAVTEMQTLKSNLYAKYTLVDGAADEAAIIAITF